MLHLKLELIILILKADKLQTNLLIEEAIQEDKEVLLNLIMSELFQEIPKTLYQNPKMVLMNILLLSILN